MTRFEITVLAQNDDGQMVLADRVAISADTTADAAKRYAALFLDSAESP